MPDATELRTGDPAEVAGYRIVRRLGQGGQGVVFLAVGDDGGKVAIKQLRQVEDKQARRRFAKEVSAARRVAPFCTARIISFELEGEIPHVVSEFIEGPSLQRLVRDDGPVSGTKLERLAIGTVTALAAIHQAGVVHRDFKPANVMVSPDGPRVIDFGIARDMSSETTVTSRIFGTPAYMAPEQIRNERVSPQTDMFAWASVIAFAATGRAPFDSGHMMAVVHRITTMEPNLDAVPDSLVDVLRQCLTKDAKQRPTAQQTLAMLLGRPTPSRDVANPTAVLAEGSRIARTSAVGGGASAGASAGGGLTAGTSAGVKGDDGPGGLGGGSRPKAAGGAAEGTGGSDAGEVGEGSAVRPAEDAEGAAGSVRDAAGASAEDAAGGTGRPAAPGAADGENAPGAPARTSAGSAVEVGRAANLDDDTVPTPVMRRADASGAKPSSTGAGSSGAASTGAASAAAPPTEASAARATPAPDSGPETAPTVETGMGYSRPLPLTDTASRTSPPKTASPKTTSPKGTPSQTVQPKATPPARASAQPAQPAQPKGAHPEGTQPKGTRPKPAALARPEASSRGGEGTKGPERPQSTQATVSTKPSGTPQATPRTPRTKPGGLDAPIYGTPETGRLSAKPELPTQQQITRDPGPATAFGSSLRLVPAVILIAILLVTGGGLALRGLLDGDQTGDQTGDVPAGQGESGAGQDPGPGASALLPDWSTGSWIGTATQPNGRVKTWTVTLTLTAGQNSGRMSIAELGCEASLGDVSGLGDSLRMTATTQQDDWGQCAGSGDVALVRVDDDTVQFAWQDETQPANQATAELTRQ
ncbi:serine/threonine-protein kinase [Kineosporia succinea]|uniref:Protein kinase domain-containing protein n=1 Tax=Kineosporia succinea TaxID=84632 RepID=A0ABT9P0G5_9ACTN|nr:serine/threonine-protein kinase [Kineosporia succinea]MDP9826165.1 hypothetical protein [Kineosporia succinea]